MVSKVKDSNYNEENIRKIIETCFKILFDGFNDLYQEKKEKVKITNYSINGLDKMLEKNLSGEDTNLSFKNLCQTKSKKPLLIHFDEIQILASNINSLNRNKFPHENKTDLIFPIFYQCLSKYVSKGLEEKIFFGVTGTNSSIDKPLINSSMTLFPALSAQNILPLQNFTLDTCLKIFDHYFYLVFFKWNFKIL